MSSFTIEENVLLGLGFSIFTEREYELKTIDGKTYKVKAIQLLRSDNAFHFICIDSDKIKYNIIIKIDTKRGLIKKAV